MVQIAELFESVSAQLLASHPGDDRGRMLRSPGLKTAGKFFAFATKDDLVVKLPAARVAELIVTGAGRPCSPVRGRPMREWVRLAGRPGGLRRLPGRSAQLRHRADRALTALFRLGGPDNREQRVVHDRARREFGAQVVERR